MEWKEIAQNKWVPIVSIAFFIYGLPGMVDDFTAWKQWLGIMSPAWSGVLVGVGVGFFSLWLWAWMVDASKRKNKSTTNLWDSLNNMASKTRDWVEKMIDSDKPLNNMIGVMIGMILMVGSLLTVFAPLFIILLSMAYCLDQM